MGAIKYLKQVALPIGSYISTKVCVALNLSDWQSEVGQSDPKQYSNGTSEMWSSSEPPASTMGATENTLLSRTLFSPDTERLVYGSFIGSLKVT